MIAQNPQWIKQGYYVDIKDRNGQWVVGLILSVTKIHTKIHLRIRFQGWGSKLDQVFLLNSETMQRLKPYRSITKGYSGPKKSAGIRQHWNFNIQNHEAKLTQFEDFTNHLSLKSGLQINQYLRGQHFFYIDFLMSVNYSNIDSIKRVYDYFRAHIKFVTQYFQQFIKSDSNIWFQAGQQQQFSAKKVYADMYSQLFQGITYIMGIYPRHTAYFKNNDKLLKQLIGNETNFDAYIVKQLITSEFLPKYAQVIDKIFQQTHKGIRNLPYQFINSLLGLFAGIQRMSIKIELKRKIMENFVYITKEYVTNMNIQQAKINQRNIQQILTQVKILSNKFMVQKQDICRWVQKGRLRLWSNLIQCETLQKKLKGINKIKQFYDLIYKKLKKSDENSQIIMSKDEFKEWIREEKLISLIFQNNEHTQVLKKAAEMVVFFYACQYQICQISTIINIWEICFNKHQAIKIIIISLWVELAQYIKNQQDWKLFSQVLLRNEGLINQDWEMNSLFSLLRNIKSQCSNQHIANIIKMIYRKVLEHQRFVSDFAKELSFFGGESKITTQIIDSTMEMIKEKKHLIFNLRMMIRLFVQLNKYTIYVPQNLISTLIEVLKDLVLDQKNDKQINLIFVIFNELMSIQQRSKSLRYESQYNVRITYQHVEQLWNIFNAVHIISLKKIFYNWFVSKTFISSYGYMTYSINSKINHQLKLQIFSNLMCDSTKLNYKKLQLNQFIIFKQLFIYANFKAGALELKVINIGNHNRKIFKVKSKDIQGIDQLWNIFIMSQNSQLIQHVSTFIKDLYLRTSAALSAQEKSNRVKFLMETIQGFIKYDERRQRMGSNNNLNMGINNDSNTNTITNNNNSVINNSQRNNGSNSNNSSNSSVNRLLSNLYENRQLNVQLLKQKSIILLTKLMADIKQRVQIPKQYMHQERVHQLTNIIVYFRDGSDAKQIQVSKDQPLIHIKHKISKHFNIPIDQFVLQNNRQLIPRQLYQIPYEKLSFQNNQFKIVKISNEVNKFVINFVRTNLYQTMIEFLIDDQLCTQAYQLLQYIDIFEPLNLCRKLQNNIFQVNQIILNKKKLFYHIYYLKIIFTILEKSTHGINDLVNSQTLFKLISHLSLTIQNSVCICYLEKLIDFLGFIFKKKLLVIKNERQQCHLSLQQVRPKIYKLLLSLMKYINSVSNQETRLFNKLLDMCIYGFDSQRKLFDSFIRDQNFQQLMYQILIRCNILTIRKSIENKLSIWLKQGYYTTQLQQKVSTFFINKLYRQIYRMLINQNSNKEEFMGIYKLFRLIIENSSNQVFKEISNIEFNEFNFIGHVWDTFKSLSDTSSTPNQLLNCIIHILIGLIRKNRDMISEQFISYVVYQCLIYTSGRTTEKQIKCLSKQNIQLIFELLYFIISDVQLQSIKNNTKIFKVQFDHSVIPVLKMLKQYHLNDYWRYIKDFNLQFHTVQKTKQPFVGLDNPGCICYINSLMQQLYMIEEFRYSILNVDTNFLNNTVTRESYFTQDSPLLIPKLKDLFLGLKYTQNQSIDPQFFTSQLWQDGHPMIRISQQMDIDQFRLILFDKIQNKLKKYYKHNVIRQLFGGTYSDQIISQQCQHSSQRQQQFLNISLDVKKHINQSFQSLVKGQTLQGQNAYFCDRCDKKVKALKRLSLKKLPPHLIISLRRFQFDYDVEQKLKINKYCEFPLQLNLQNYSQGKLHEMDKKNQNRTNLSMNEQQNKNNKKTKYPTQYFVYKLKGVVIHSGSADSGHYYSYIENTDGKWFEFNDDNVTQFDIKQLEKQAFGGRQGEYTRVRNAYLLFYERKVKTEFDRQNMLMSQQNRMSEQIQIDGDNSAQNINNSNNSLSSVHNNQQRYSLEALSQRYLQIPQNKQTRQNIILQNKKIRLYHLMYSRQYSDFVMNIIRQMLYPIYQLTGLQIIKQNRDCKPIFSFQQTDKLIGSVHLIESVQDMHFALFQYLISYAFLIQLRLKPFFNILETLNMIKLMFFTNGELERRLNFMELFLGEITHQAFIDQFIINPNHRQKAKVVGNFIFETIKIYLDIYQYQPNQQIPRVIKSILKLLMKNIMKHSNNITQILVIIRKILLLKQLHQDKINPIIKFIIQKSLPSQLLTNSMSLIYKQEFLKARIQQLYRSNESIQNSQNSLTSNNPKRKSSDLSAKQEQQANTQALILKIPQMETQSFEDYNQNSRFSALFGLLYLHGSKSKVTSQKQTWIILWKLHTYLIDIKNELDHFNNIINELKGIKSDEVVIRQSQTSQQNVQSSKKSQSINQSFVTNQSQTSRVQSSQNQSSRISSSQNQSQNRNRQTPLSSPNQQRQSSSQNSQQGTQQQENGEPNGEEESQLNEQDIRQVRNVSDCLQMINTRYRQVESVRRSVNSSGGVITQRRVQQVNYTQQIIFQSRKKQKLQESSQSGFKKNKANNQIKQRQNTQNISSLPAVQQQPSMRQLNRITQPQIQIQDPQTIQKRQKIQKYQKIVQRLQNEYELMKTKICGQLSKLKQEKLQKLIFQQKDTKSIIALAEYLTLMMSNNKSVHNLLMDALQHGLRDYQSIKYRPFMIILEKVIATYSNDKQKLTDVVFLLRNVIRHNDKYFVQCDIIHQFILRYCALYPAFQAAFRQQARFIQQLKAWITQKRTPGSQTLRKHKDPQCQRHALKIHGIIVSDDIKEYQNFTLYKLQSLQKIKQMRFTSNIKYNRYPNLAQNYKKGDPIQYFNGRWFNGVVVQVYFGVLLCKVLFGNKSEFIWVTQDDQRIQLRPRREAQTMDNAQRNNNFRNNARQNDPRQTNPRQTNQRSNGPKDNNSRENGSKERTSQPKMQLMQVEE